MSFNRLFILVALGTYFTTVRVISQREGDADTPYTRIQNLDRVWVVVE